MKCELEDCKHKANFIMGDCKYCSKKFCDRHYIMEIHNCVKLTDHIASRREKHKESIMNQKCIADKIIHL